MPTFDERAPEWDSPERIERAEAVAAVIREAVPLTRDLSVLEIGAGTGLLGLALAQEVGTLVLADPSVGMLAVADEKVRAAGLENVRTLRFALAADPRPAERFDLVVSLMALHHVPDTAAAIDDLFAMVEPGGRLALVDLDAEDGTFHSDPDADVHHGFDRGELGRRIEAAGFRDVTFTTADEIASDGRVYPLFLVVARRP
ncbi:MAG: class I SAM-dependent methyltransferase [Chloroflexota bacterium]|jgi:ubiquinone/menaquinone biosynthesis C-methylase UbiE|nr:class I SAM-dependent methyltransferase [Chloroflexota bacterium]MDH5242925.1 class I SAM-dependent methyltransferase [Chloroflexota bacterium]